MKQILINIHQCLSCVVAGVLSSFLFIAIGGRVVMKALAIVSNQQLHFSIEGTIATMVFSTSIGIIGGLLFSMLQRYVAGSSFAKGGAFGLLLFVVLIPMLPSDVQREAVALESYIPLAITMFGLLLMGFGVSLEFLSNVLKTASSSSHFFAHPSEN